MKRLFSVVLGGAMVMAAFATGQITEKIVDYGVGKGMATYLLELDSVSFSTLKGCIPNRLTSTALWRGYIGHWKIERDSLFLDSVMVGNREDNRFVPIAIDDIYASRRTASGYFADWVSDTLRVVSGDFVRYVHMDWKSDWEIEEYVVVESGVVKDRIVYHNRVINPVAEGEARRVIDSLDFGFVPKRMILRIGYQDFDADGKPTECTAEVVRGSGDAAVDEKVVQALNDLAVMRRIVPVYYIRGRYCSPEIDLPIPASRGHDNT